MKLKRLPTNKIFVPFFYVKTKPPPPLTEGEYRLNEFYNERRTVQRECIKLGRSCEHV